MLKETSQWVTLAQADYEDGIFCWKNNRYRLCVYCVQQAVEKIVKAYIIETQDKAPPKSHDIEYLISLTNLDIHEIGNPKVFELTKAYTRVRYKDLDTLYYSSRDKVEPLYKLATKLYLWISNKLHQQ